MNISEPPPEPEPEPEPDVTAGGETSGEAVPASLTETENVIPGT